MTRQFVTVALNGDGGDETLAGYPRYQAMEFIRVWKRLPRIARQALFQLANRLPDGDPPHSLPWRIKRLLRLGLDPAKLGNAMRRADSGDHIAQQEIFGACLEDAHVHSVFSKRTRRVLSRTLHIIPAIEDDERSQAAADLVREMVLGGQLTT
jgi:asparagine synthetase B (glutamine-hydrolysing)